jgi:hypothetical protein
MSQINKSGPQTANIVLLVPSSSSCSRVKKMFIFPPLSSTTQAEAAMAAAAATIFELDPSHERAGRVIEDIVRLERRIFPKHESLARSFHDELKRRNSGLIYSMSGADSDEIIGYAMYTCTTSLCATITKLAGENPHGAGSIASLIQF